MLYIKDFTKFAIKYEKHAINQIKPKKNNLRTKACCVGKYVSLVYLLSIIAVHTRAWSRRFIVYNPTIIDAITVVLVQTISVNLPILFINLIVLHGNFITFINF